MREHSFSPGSGRLMSLDRTINAESLGDFRYTFCLTPSRTRRRLALVARAVTALRSLRPTIGACAQTSARKTASLATSRSWFQSVISERSYSCSLPSTVPKAKVSAVISTLIFLSAGTLTATGVKPRPQHDPGRMATSSTAPVSASVILNSGDLPIGDQPTYRSPALP